MKLDPLKTSLQSFLAWRKNGRASVKTRQAMLNYCGKDWRISEDHKQAYFHAVEDFARPVWDSEDDTWRNGTGFYADNWQGDVIRWAVVKIAPANKKQGREALFAPITYCTGWEGVTMHLDCAGSEDDARRWGEQVAEREAEEAQEFHAKDQAEQQINEAKNEAYNLLLDTKRIIAGARASTLHPDICANIREYIRDNHNELRECIQRIHELRADFWLAVNNY